jgi:hypothetical protein
MVFLEDRVVVDHKIVLLVEMVHLDKVMLEEMVQEVPDIQAAAVVVRELLEQTVLLQ